MLGRKGDLKFRLAIGGDLKACPGIERIDRARLNQRFQVIEASRRLVSQLDDAVERPVLVGRERLLLDLLAPLVAHGDIDGDV